jgi:hypothetical protein
MGGAWGTYGEEERCIQGFSGEILCKMTTWNMLARMRSNIKSDPKETGWDITGWINLAKDKERWQALLNRVVNLWVPQDRISKY